jgi:transglutaminase-like putative cysteine protease
MSRLIQILMLGMLPLVAGCTGLAGVSPGSGEVQLAERDGPYHIPKQIRYSYTLRNTTGQLLENAQFWTYAPVPQTSHQKVRKIKTNLPYRSVRDDLGNEMLHFELANIPPYGARIVSITVDLLVSGSPVGMSAGRADRFTRPEPHIESDDTRIVSLARSLSNTRPEAGARKAYDWVAEHLFTEVYVAEDRGALYALQSKTGDCTEFSYLLTALYRAQQIPARPIAGYVFSGNGIVKAVDYHNWTEFYTDGAWQIADAQKHAFRDKQTDYVAMRRIVSGAQNPFNTQRFSFAGAGLEVSMN